MARVGSADPVELVGPVGHGAGGGEGTPGDVHPVSVRDPGGDAVGVDLVQGGDEGDGSSTHVRYCN
ncbi:hypothetical protein WDV91_13950 [Curtobacterium flaccumfaciens pv. flaccumfaciens]